MPSSPDPEPTEDPRPPSGAAVSDAAASEGPASDVPAAEDPAADEGVAVPVGANRGPLMLPPLVPPDQVPPVRRRKRGSKGGPKAASGAGASGSDGTAAVLAAPSLASPLLSGRSLEPTVKRRRLGVLRDHPRWIIGALVVVLVVVVLVAGKLLAERAADSAMSERSTELEEMLADATPEEFLAFSSGVQTAGSLAERTRDLDGFVNVKATAGQAFIRFQPSGWWAGFTERCLVAVVREDGVTVTVPKTACIRVEAPPS